MSIQVIYPGTFDPITHGHSDLIERATGLFDRVVVAIAESSTKKTILPIEVRVEVAREVLKEYSNVEVMSFNGLLVDFALKQNSRIIIRGLRAISDFEYEFQLSAINHHLQPKIETLFLPASEKYGYISSSLVREVAKLGGDVSAFVHPCVAKALKEKHSWL